MSGGGGQRVDTDDLREFAKRVRGLLKDFGEGAGGKETHGRTGVSCTAFGSFGEATAMGNQYNAMRDALRDVLNQLESAVDDAQKDVNGTADDFEGNDAHVAASFKDPAAAPPPPTDVDASWQ